VRELFFAVALEAGYQLACQLAGKHLHRRSWYSSHETEIRWILRKRELRNGTNRDN
jgi:hypothetical protein